MTMLGVIIIVFLIACLLSTQRLGPTDKTNINIHPVEGEKISKVIDRIEWSILRENRVNYPVRYLVWGLWVTFLGSYLFSNTLPNPSIFIRNWVIISIILLSLHGFYYWHTDKFSTFASLSGVEKVRELIGIKKGDLSKLEPCNKIFLGADPPWTFTDNDYIIGTKSPGNY
jgi:hypothetical protein